MTYVTKIINKTFITILLVALFCSGTVALAVSSSYSNNTISGANVRYVTIDMNNKNIYTKILNANNQMNSSDSLASMAKKAGAFAAINGTYFEAYNGTPVPWGTIIKDGKVLHISNGGSVAGITSDGKLIIDRLSFEFKGYINDVYRAIPWRINHPSTEAEAITIFTPEYNTTVVLQTGAKAVIVNNGTVTEIANYDFNVPSEGFAIVYNSNVTHLVDERYKVGDKVRYETIIKTTFTDSEDWNDVVSAVGAGPSLIINGNITADGTEEGFFEDKINKNKAGRSFIGATSEGKILIGNIGAATIIESAEIAKNLGLVNAMCLDGGGSIALYYPSANINMAGRNINNGLAFLESKQPAVQGYTAAPTSSDVLVNGEKVSFDAYNIDGNNYIKLRDLAMAISGTKKQFSVTWDAVKNAINLISASNYEAVGGELTKGDGATKTGYVTTSKIYKDGAVVSLSGYNINNNNYFKLRDVAQAFNIGVEWDGITNTVVIDTLKDYK